MMRMRGTKAWPAVLGIVAGALALFGTVGIVGVELPLATMPLSAGRLADALLTASESLRSMPLVEERASEIVTFLQSATAGRLATLLWTLCAGHVLACGAAITLAALDLRGAHRAWRPVVAGALVVTDAAVVSVLCSAMSWQLYLVVRSVARGNPWAVGRGVAGLELTLTPGLGLVVAALLGVCAIALALVGRRGASVAAAS